MPSSTSSTTSTGDLRVDNAAPVIFAELDRREIRRLAASDDVSAIFLYEREGFDDLANSIAIAQSDDAHDLGYTGSGVNVAVYERGPDDTTNLQITARFRTDPDTSQHSRHTHGIVKNRERGQPHGHAPDCRLHSANDYDLDAIRWAAHDRGCTVISQSFHRDAEQTSDDLSFDDIYKDWLALNWPYPTICEAAGNGIDDGVRQPQGIQPPRGGQPRRCRHRHGRRYGLPQPRRPTTVTGSCPRSRRTAWM